MIDSHEITDEILAAFIDGNATEDEISLINDVRSENSYISEIIDICNGYTPDIYPLNDFIYHIEFDWPELTDSVNIDYDNLDPISTGNLNIDLNTDDSFLPENFNTDNDSSNLIDGIDNMDFVEL